ncbi:bifunctional phosphopantothenoylcysteine decarboxylase/phosphopantothenate--cysteine ligase CoaBC [Kallipyga gabonensis]|uniref:bifunctional phosphopantothenoylcysteine decarboxylase/phosphopantothenate--cysteine ligase CoaBC n=1 Tax=Kallipyga gabonensis TaxID=1686287 RepID=UPI0006B56E9A|nr:bifunctional phosphopantothenoylcysteine decarboxylase/phosphopantothenate--cysteine ligase CoaBC [Kallipyga gabonensis]
MNRLQGKKILVGVSGGIAIYKTLTLLSLLNKLGAQTRVVMTAGAGEFVTPLTFQTMSKNRVYMDLFSEEDHFIPHIDLTRWADVFLIAPATANILAKMAHGISDDLLSSTALAAHCPVLVSPAMNVVMYRNPATQENIQVLRNRGIGIIEPESGLLACDEKGEGRMPEAQDLAEVLDHFFSPKDLDGVSLLVTGGPTREMIDPVRFLSNRSSGKQGIAIAREAVKRGGDVTFVHGPLQAPVPKGVKDVPVTSTEDLYLALKDRFEATQALIMAAAPADMTPVQYMDQKMKKGEKVGNFSLALKETTDVLKTLGAEKKGQVLVGFAAETQFVEEYAKKKLKEKNLDFIVANDVSARGAGFAGDTNIVTIFTKEDREDLPLQSKEEVARVIVDRVVLALQEKGIRR